MSSGELPKNWALARLDQVATLVFGQSPPSSTYNTEGRGLPFFQGKAEFGPLYPTPSKWCTEPTRIAEVGDVLISVRAPVGPTNVADTCCAIGRGLAAIRTHISNDYIRYWLSRSRHELASKGTGTTFSAITKDVLKSHPIPIAPLNEQHRIVEKIETLFAHIDKGEEALREVQKLLKRYRQSILKAAVTGELTRDWREANEHKLEPASDLLERILETRRQNWQGRVNYKEPTEPDIACQPELPNGWVWATFDQLFEVFGGATPSKSEPNYWGGNVPWVSSGEVAFCRIKETAQQITQSGYESCSTRIHPAGTILVAMIGEGKTRGQAAILDIPACNNQNAAAIRVSQSGIPPEFVYYFLLGRYEQSRREGQGGNQPALNGTKVKSFAMPLPSSDEMREIVFRVEEAFSTSSSLEAACQSELARSKSLRQSILKSAFTGQLVPQHPDDEPAGELLARIRAERETKTKGKSRRKANA